MPDLLDGESIEMKGSGARPYILKNVGGLYSCTCPAWRNQSNPIEQRTCKHLRKLRGDAAEEARLGGALPQRPVKSEGEESSAPPLLLAEAWDSATDLAGWWMSEKLDGVRAYWDGRQFLSRQGNLFHAPDWFIEDLPETPFDGELWIDRKKFQRTVSIVRRQDKSDLWAEVRFLVFDAPSATGVFEERLAHVKAMLVDGRSRFAQPHEHVRCNDLQSLRAELARVEALGGEGLMLRQPGSRYESGRSTTLLKVKSFRDAEAVVIGHQAGAGKHKGRLGALLARLPDGTEFAIGTGFSDRERGAPPPVGATVTFRYQELSEAGVPRFPSYVGLRLEAANGQQPLPAMATEAAEATPTTLIVVEAALPATPIATGGTAGSTAETAGTPRHFEYVDGKSSKFWEVAQSGCDVTTRWGRIGTAGQSKTKTFADETTAAKQAMKLIQEKTGEGYVET
jgi:DNA ligase